MSHVSVWHPEKLILTLQRARTSLSLPQIIFVNGKHILIDGNTQKETRTSNKKSTFFMSHTDALYQSEKNAPLVQHECKISQNRKSKIWDEKWHPIPSIRVEGSMLSLTNINFSRISKEMVFAAAMCTFTGQVFRSGYVSGFSQRLCVGRVGWRIWE